jgi:lipopolysaccharide assembly protein A
MSDPTERTPARRPGDKPDKAGNARAVVAAGVGAVAAVFAVINLDDVEVNWLVGSWQTPLILVIVLSMLLGAGLDRLLVRRARRRKREQTRAGRD